MRSQNKIINYNGQKIYIGIDVHVKKWIITIMTDVSYYKTFSQDSEVKLLVSYLKRNFPGGKYYSVYEAGFCGFSIHRELVKNGINNIIVNPADIPTTDKEKRQKEDKRDSRKLAKSLKNGELTGIYIFNEEMEELRSLVRYRKTVVKEICRNKNRVKSFLKVRGISIPVQLDKPSKYWSSRFSKWLKSVELRTQYGTFVLQETIATVEYLRKKLLKINREFRVLNKDSKYSSKIELLKSVPGVGLISSLTLLTEIDSIKRFNTLDKLCSYIGLIPSTNSSGEKEKVGNITRRSNKKLRSSIIESSWVAIKQDIELFSRFNELTRRMNSNEAIVRIAKKLVNRIRYVLKTEQKYVKASI